jgi:hypothetical protein
MAHLVVVARNAEPQREARYPHTWFLNTQQGRSIRLAITHVGTQPRVKEKNTAA